MRAFKNQLPAIRRGKIHLPFFAVLILMVLWACQLAQNTKVEDTVSFDKLYDTLSRFDSVVIVFKDPQGNLLDTVFEGKVDSHSKIRNLDVKGWDGGKAQILISGFDAGQLVYQVEKKYDGTSDQIDANVILVVPDAAISSDVHELTMAAGDSLKYPAITVGPAALSDKSVIWSSSNPDVLRIGPDLIWALKPGSAVLKAQLKVSPATQLSINVSVNSSDIAPDSLLFESDTLKLAAGGSSGKLAIKAAPGNASNAVTWSVESSTIAKVDSNGNVSGLSKGITKLIAVSKAKPTLSISAMVVVSDPVAIEKVRFKKNPITLYLGGSEEVLAVEVTPSQAVQSVDLTVLEQTLAVLNGTTLKPLAAGTVHVVAKSTADPAKSDTLLVTILGAIRIDSVRISPRSNQQIFVGGPSLALAGQAFPATAPQLVAWRSSNPAVATVSEAGMVAAIDNGTAWIFALSPADSSKRDSVSITVKKDIPNVAILSPANNSYTNQTSITVKWTVDGQLQDTLPKENLKAGPNTITRTAKGASGSQGSATIVVNLDTLKPLTPILTGPSSTSLPPVWHWATGGGGGSGDYRFKLGDADFSQGATQGRDTIFALKDGLVSGTTYSLFVAERDLAGNWSDAAKWAIKYDLTKPVVTLTTPAFTGGTLYTNAASVNLSGTVTGPSPISSVTYSIGSGTATPITLSAGSWTITGIAVTEGVPVNVTISATDAVGNAGSVVIPILMDNTAPGAPAFVITPTTPTKAISGSWTWAAGADGANGSGLNGHFRYALNSGTWKDTTGLGLNGLVLAEGNNVLALQEQDRAGLWSVSATSLVKVDLTAPTIAILSHANPANITTTHITFTVSASDSGSGVQSVTVNGQTAGNGVLTNSGGTWTSADLTLKGGANSLMVTATDQVGNSRNLTFTVNVNIPASLVSITDPPANTITNADSIDVSYTIDGTSGKRRFGLVEGSNTLSITSPANASGAVGRDSVKVIRDATAPKAPTLATNASNTNGTATWTWTSNGDNTGGVGVKSPPAFRFSFNGGTTWTTTSSTSTTQTAEGVYALIVQEQDKAGNWSASSAAKSISVDKTPPVVTIQTPDNYITNKSSVIISYTEQDSTKSPVSKTKTVSLATDNGPNTVTISSVADAAGNVGTASITVYRRSNVVFVKTSAAGAGDGTSWDNAAGGLESGIAKAGSGGQIWLAAGTYKPSTASGFAIKSAMSIYGGFSTTGSPYTIAQRDSSVPYKTILSSTGFANDTVVNVQGSNPISLFELNTLQVSGSGSMGLLMEGVTNFQIRNCNFQQFNLAIQAHSVSGTFGNCIVQQNSGGFDIVDIWLTADLPDGVVFQNCVFQNNSLNLGAYGFGYIISASSLGKLSFLNCSLLDSVVNLSDQAYQLKTNDPYPEAVVTVSGSTVVGGKDKIFHGGTLYYTGLGNTPP